MPETEASPLFKAQFIGTGRDGSELSNVLATSDEQRSLYKKANAITPPLDPVSMANLFEMSGALRSNVDAYCVNIDSFGHMLEPVIDIDADDAFEKVKLAMVQERILGLNPDGSPAGGDEDDDIDKVLEMVKASGYPAKDRFPDPGEDLPEPTDDEVTKRMASIRREMLREKLAAEKFFSFCTVDQSFEALRMKTRQDVETTGNGYWEVLRNEDGEIVQFNYVPGYTVRLMALEANAQQVTMQVRATPITAGVEKVSKRFRKYVQVANGAIRGEQLVWFKEYGDPRVYSHLSGTEYPSVEAMRRKEPGANPATELIHFRIHSTRSPYGLPRWVSEMLAVVGSRHADEVNLAYFENKSVPPMAIMVSGGRLNQDTVTRLENYVRNEIRGKRNWHKIMILQAEPAENQSAFGMSSGQAKIELKPLTDAQNNDAQFLKYKEHNTDAIGSVFRLPRLLRGDARDFNRATAQTSLEFTEQQVFAPLRKEFDYYMNRCVLPELGINFWRFKSKGPDFSDPTKMLEAVNAAADASYLTPEELRKLASRGFGMEFPKLEADWTQRPVQLTLAGIQTSQMAPDENTDDAPPVTDAAPRPPEPADNDLEKQARQLIALQKEFARLEASQDDN